MVGEQERIVVTAILWNDAIEEHLERHDVTYEDVLAVIDSDPLTYRNLPGRGGTHVLIGPDNRGRILYISVRPTSSAEVWEPITGWRSARAGRLWRQERRGS